MRLYKPVILLIVLVYRGCTTEYTQVNNLDKPEKSRKEYHFFFGLW